MPITWRNVESANPNAGFQPLQAAGSNINNAFDIFSKVIQQRQATDQANLASADDGAKQAYLDRLQLEKTSEGVEAFEASPEAAVMKQALTAASRGAVRGAGEARVSSTRANTLAANTFDDTLKTRAEAPILAQHNTLVANGRIKEADAFRTANPQVRDWSGATQNAYATGRAREADVLTDVRNRRTEQVADVTQPNLLAAQRQLTATQGQRDRLQVQGLNITGETQTAQQQANADAQQLRALTAEVADVTQRYGAAQAQVRGVHKELVQQLGVKTLTTEGLPDFTRMTPGEVALFDKAAAARNIPGSKFNINGDTALGEDLLSAIGNSGKYSPTVVQSAAQSIRSAFNSSPLPRVGNDADALARATAAANVAMDRQDAGNLWHNPSSDNLGTVYKDLVQEANVIAKNRTGAWSNSGDVTSEVQGMLIDLATKGVEIKSRKLPDGTMSKPMRITPSPNIVRGYLQSADTGFFFDNELRLNTKKAIEDYYNSEEGFKSLAQGTESQVFRDRQKVEQQFRELRNPVKK